MANETDEAAVVIGKVDAESTTMEIEVRVLVKAQYMAHPNTGEMVWAVVPAAPLPLVVGRSSSHAFEFAPPEAARLNALVAAMLSCTQAHPAILETFFAGLRALGRLKEENVAGQA